MRVLGIDCGTEYTGYGIVDLLSGDLLCDDLLPRDPPSGGRAHCRDDGRREIGHRELGRRENDRKNGRRDNERLLFVACGAIHVSPREPMPARLARISRALQELIATHRPDRVAIEDVFYAVNVKSALKLGQVRGVAMLAAASAGLEVAEYAPLAIKSAVVGYGKAEKHQVQQMVARLLQLDKIPEPADAADALAIAICHLHTAATLERQRSVPKAAAR